MEYYNYIKALHLIFVITWFAGLFYIPRLFIYHTEASEKAEPDKSILSNQFKLMTRRLWYIITWPSAVLAIGFAVWLLVLVPTWLQEAWMQLKLFFVLLLVLYHLKCHHLFLQLQRDLFKWSSYQLRLWNEGSTLILFSVVFLVMIRDAFDWIYGLISLMLLALLLMLGIRIYRVVRNRDRRD